MQHLAFGRDPLDDPLNASWDAAVRPDRAPSAETDPDDIAFLRRVHKLEVVALARHADDDAADTRPAAQEGAEAGNNGHGASWGVGPSAGGEQGEETRRPWAGRVSEVTRSLRRLCS